jgi:hypothetical protein
MKKGNRSFVVLDIGPKVHLRTKNDPVSAESVERLQEVAGTGVGGGCTL